MGALTHRNERPQKMTVPPLKPNRHPCDELADVKAQIEALEAKSAGSSIELIWRRLQQLDIYRAALQRIVAEAESDDGATAWDGADIARAALKAAEIHE